MVHVQKSLWQRARERARAGVKQHAYTIAATVDERFMNGGAANAGDREGVGVLDDAEQVVERIQGKEVHAQDVTACQQGIGGTYCALASSTPRLGRLRLGVKTLLMSTTS